MAKLGVFNSISIDGFFTDDKSDMSWAHASAPDPEFNQFVSNNASHDGILLFGRKTYEMMAAYWPTPQAMKDMPAVAKGMNSMQKVVFSETLKEASWENTRLFRGNLVEEVKNLKSQSEKDIVILGSGSIASQLAEARLIDQYQMVVVPILLGKGRTQFEGVTHHQNLLLTESRSFRKGNIFLSYSVN
ncbi:MAG: dihydrofolate reductase [Bdellovibrio sp.]|nr:dihydrofolate reductase [Bdellovibrio sp.]